jgi:hypothetical protein
LTKTDLKMPWQWEWDNLSACWLCRECIWV